MIGKILGAVLGIVLSSAGLYYGSRKLLETVRFVRTVRGTDFTAVSDIAGQSVVKVSGVARKTGETVSAPLNDDEALVYKYEKQSWESDENRWETDSEEIGAAPFQVEGSDGAVIDVVHEPSRVFTTDENTERTFEGNPEKLGVDIGTIGGITVAETYEREVEHRIEDGDAVVVYGPMRETESGVRTRDGGSSEPLVVMDSEAALASVRGVVLKYGFVLLFLLFVLGVSVWNLL